MRLFSKVTAIFLAFSGVIFLIAAFVFPNAEAAPLSPIGTLSQIRTFGNWTVMRSVDSMTDKVSCAARYKGKRDFELTTSTLYIDIRDHGRPQSVKLRFDSKPAGDTRLLLTQDERNLAMVILYRDEFEELLTAKRLRFLIYTRLNSIYEGDLDLTGHLKAIEAMRTLQCGFERDA
jgi:hypothetical protein